MEIKARITKELQEAYRNCADDNCNAKCPASMSNGNCFFEFLDKNQKEILSAEVNDYEN